MKQGERRWQQSQEECARTALDLTESQRELAEVTAELDELRHKFRDKMETFAAGGKVERTVYKKREALFFERVIDRQKKDVVARRYFAPIMEKAHALEGL